MQNLGKRIIRRLFSSRTMQGNGKHSSVKCTLMKMLHLTYMVRTLMMSIMSTWETLARDNWSSPCSCFLLFRTFLTLKMASAQVVETSVYNNSPSQDSSHPGHHFQARYYLYLVLRRTVVTDWRFDNLCGSHLQTLKMASAQVVETSVYNNSPSQESNYPGDHFQSRYYFHCQNSHGFSLRATSVSL